MKSVVRGLFAPRIERALERIRAVAVDPKGAVTIDWVVLTAGIVALIFGIVNLLDDEFAQIWDDMFEFVYSNSPIFS